MQQLESGADVFIMNTENVSNKDVWDKILNMGIEFLAVDESHRFKAFNGTRTKALHKLTDQHQCRYKFIATGSPILQSALDLWSQFYILSPSILGSNYYAFRSQYFYDVNASMPSHVHFPNFVPKDEKYFKANGYSKEQSLDGLNEVIYRHADRVMKDDVLDLPPRTYQTLEVEMTKEQKRIYTEMRDDLVAFKEGKQDLEELLATPEEQANLPEIMSADLAIVKTLRLQQLICGIFTDSEGTVSLLKTSREKILKETLEALSANPENKIIVWSVFTPTYTQIEEVCNSLGLKYVMLTGRQNKDEKQQAQDDFNTDPSVQIMIANQAAGGTGTQMQGGNYEIYYSRNFTLEHDLQADSRAYRGGQKRQTTRIDIVTPDTIDARMVVALADKRKHADDILVAPSEFSKQDVLSLI